jgi:hypothetical protein
LGSQFWQVPEPEGKIHTSLSQFCSYCWSILIEPHLHIYKPSGGIFFDSPVRGPISFFPYQRMEDRRSDTFVPVPIGSEGRSIWVIFLTLHCLMSPHFLTSNMTSFIFPPRGRCWKNKSYMLPKRRPSLDWRNLLWRTQRRRPFLGRRSRIRENSQPPRGLTG